MDSVEARTMRKVSARLIPFLVICYFIAFLDRVNVGFAALTMKRARPNRDDVRFRRPHSSSSPILSANCSNLFLDRSAPASGSRASW